MVGVEPAAAEQDPAQEKGGVDRRQLALHGAQAGLHVEEVVEESLVARDAVGLRALRQVPEELQGGQHPRAGGLAADPAVLHPDGAGVEREAQAGDAAGRRRGPAVGRQAVRRIGRLPEEAEGAALQVRDRRALRCGDGAARGETGGREGGARGEETATGKHHHLRPAGSAKKRPPPVEAGGGPGTAAAETATAGGTLKPVTRTGAGDAARTRARPRRGGWSRAAPPPPPAPPPGAPNVRARAG